MQNLTQALTVTQLNSFIKESIFSKDTFRMLCVEGEISGLSFHSSGHIYFTLKDSDAAIKAVMFKGYQLSLRFRPENGMKVMAVGDVSYYERTGTVQIYVQHLYEAGVGLAHTQFELLKEKLAKEGLFDQAHKKPIPKYPERIALISSPTGAAVQDLMSVLLRRYPPARFQLFPVNVQGVSAPADIIQAIRAADSGEFDTIILARGGGSAEDLSVFNDEGMARAIYACKTPVITGIGHETDFTIADFAADLRAPTPSVAAELAVPDKFELLLYLSSLQDKFEKLLSGRVSSMEERLKKYGYMIGQVARFEAQSRAHFLETAKARMKARVALLIGAREGKLREFGSRLEKFDESRMLLGGYARVIKDGRAVSQAGELKAGDRVVIKFSDGEKTAEII